ncbi:probable ATP-dependent RNA helicase kurz [Drosophila sulfurigaster albostrigata]|uniref:probable ATP-dependent RNA helicase kurz n=1 Tax=Drosophila sulfurigaster albostrigata TaxID=89887 RepID=UPI002D219C3F|nr:probable ATP-dependent RNA helicase kurz [Drosophila sulfurigaster albostrigata]
MGKKVYNAKARQNPQTIVDNSAVKNIKIETENVLNSGKGKGNANYAAGYDEANALVLPSQKRATKTKIEKHQNVKILSKKQRKHLQSIVDKKKKKEGRAQLLEDLAAVQIPEAELKQYTSISQVQTIGKKRLHTLDEYLAKKQEKQQQQSQAQLGRRVNAIKGAGKRRLLVEEQEALDAKRKNPNVVDADESDETTTDESEDEQVDSPVPAPAPIPVPTPTPAPVVEQPTTSAAAKTTTAATKANPPATPAYVHKTVYVPVDRSDEVQAARLRLPILAEEQQVMELINEHPIVIVAGETGSGKTTQLPQFLYEAGYAQHKMIGITEPRRVAAIAMSKRVAHEMNLPSSEVSYLIRFEGNVTPATRIKFMTDGVLLKEIETDFLLSKYSVIVLDEAHERSVYTDILVGLLSRIVPLRQKRSTPLKLIIMSATLRVSDFTENTRLFKTPPPLIKVEARQFPVTVHFQKRTPDDYVAEAYRKTLKIHSQLPEGGILIFVTGQQEVNQLVRKLRRTFPYKPDKEAKQQQPETKQPAVELEQQFELKRVMRNLRKSKKKFLAQISLPSINLDDYKLPGDDTEADMHSDLEGDPEDELDVDDDDDDELQLDDDQQLSAPGTKQPLWVLPLYSLLSSEQQNRIFEPIPEGCRLCVVSTNVAETSLTIPHIKYVVDSGRQKTRLYDKLTGVSAFVVTYTSKASADQRAGRAGRVSAGHCYRLYSSAVYNDLFPEFSQPDIQQKPVDDLMLQMRCMGIDRVLHFPFPSPPDALQLQAAEQRLSVLGALEATAKNSSSSTTDKDKELPPAVTQLGRVISRFPVAPRYGKMLALSNQFELLPYTVCLVAALSVQELLVETGVQRDEDVAPASNNFHKMRLSWANHGQYQLLGDPMVLLRAVGAAEYAHSQHKLDSFCASHGLRSKAIGEVRKLRVQLTNEINLNVSNVESLCVDPQLKPPTESQARLLRQILLAGMGDQVARKVPLDEISDKDERRRLKYAYNCADMEEPAFLHVSSVLKQPKPEWIVYQEAYELQQGDSSKMFIRGITAIEPEWLLVYVPQLCNIRQVKEEPAPRYNATKGNIYCHVDATFGKAGWELPLGEIEMPLSEQACCYFGMFLLEGSVCSKLAQFKSKLRSTPASLIKSWSNLNDSVLYFKKALINQQIHSRQTLFDHWQRDPSFLLAEYQRLLYDVAISELSPFWPPLEASK